MIDTAVHSVYEHFSDLHQEIVSLPLDDYDAYEDDHDDSVLEELLQDQLLTGPVPYFSTQTPRPQELALGLGAKKRYNTRQRAVRAAYLGYRRRGAIHYTQKQRRWDGIRLGLNAIENEHPLNADCSAFVTWCYWDATRIYDLRDFVNGANWRYGFTGTMTRRGQVIKPSRLISGDSIFYGGTWAVPHHVALYVGNGRVISHGSESGPLLLKFDYRHINHCRRFIR